MSLLCVGDALVSQWWVAMLRWCFGDGIVMLTRWWILMNIFSFSVGSEAKRVAVRCVFAIGVVCWANLLQVKPNSGDFLCKKHIFFGCPGRKGPRGDGGTFFCSNKWSSTRWPCVQNYCLKSFGRFCSLIQATDDRWHWNLHLIEFLGWRPWSAWHKSWSDWKESPNLWKVDWKRQRWKQHLMKQQQQRCNWL